jgi:hypothetical protein
LQSRRLQKKLRPEDDFLHYWANGDAIEQFSWSISTTAAMLVGNNVNGAYSESDIIRERAADNLGMAGDSQLMQLNSGSRLTVSVPANTKIYVVWTQHGKESAKVARASAAP